jgi:hypothetical protein
MHQATFDRWQHSPLGWTLCALAVALILQPRSVPLFMATVLCDAVYAFQCLPETANHLLFEGFVCFAWLVGFGQHCLGRRRAGVPWGTLFAPDPGGRHPLAGSLVPLKMGLLLVYWLSVLHKLNYDFVDPETSCASYMYRRVAEALPFLPRAPWAEHVAIWSTLLAEAALPVLLLLARTWQLGLVAALSFHLMLGFDPTPGIYSFTGLLYALFVLVLPQSFVDLASQRLLHLQHLLGRPALLYVRLAGLAACISILGYGATRDDRWAFHAGFVFFLVWAAVVSAGYVVILTGLPTSTSSALPFTPGRARPRTPVLLWVLPSIVLANGLNPYLGLRTQLSFSMFSNLRTEGDKSNHLFMPRLLELGNYQEDLVEILAASDAELADFQRKQLLLPYFEFRRMVSGAEDLRVTYLRQGEEHTFECAGGVCNDTELAEPYSRLMGRLLYFRPVDKGPRMLCRH